MDAKAKIPEKTRRHSFIAAGSDMAKYQVLYALVALRLIQDRTLVYVKNMTTAYKVFLFFERFGLKVEVYNTTFAKQTRKNIIGRFLR
jgi:ATP-dependent RNA helicase DDX56/DBP9